MNTLQQWAQRLIGAAPPHIKAWAGSNLPGLKQWIGERAYNQIDQAALQQFAATHAPAAPVARSLENGLAVIVPCYNHSRYLEATFTSLFRQTHRPFEVVCVDDHSTDDTWARLQQLAVSPPEGIKLTLLQTPANGGQAAALNLGIQATTASLCTILNDDDYLMHDALAAIWTIMQHRSDLALLGSSARILAGEGCPPGGDEANQIAALSGAYTSIPLQEYRPADVLQLTDANTLNMTHSGATFYRSAWQAAGGYYADKQQRVVVFADRDFQLRVAALFPAAVAAANPFVYWRAGSSVDSGLYS
jgi:glycosyltransferase involved in cell wall biosynthesis